MLNQVVIVGRLVKDPELKELENEKKIGSFTLAVQRSFKNAEGVYETDFIPVKLINMIATNVCEYAKQGDIVGVKGRLQNIEKEDGTKELELVAEKVSFLSSAPQAPKKGNEED